MELSVFSDEHFMQKAFEQAQIAFEKGEVPVGAVVVCKNRIIAKAYNQTETLCDPTAHAEMIAITAASNYLGGKYLQGCSLYVTLEPCTMCAGALYWSQIAKLVYGARDENRGYSRLSENILHPKTVIYSGIMNVECKQLLDIFFKNLRE
ncbi:MAG: nucleoside deaminase [Cyclobacteriaceae bacterium]